MQWGKDLVRLRPDLPLAGSPERTIWRNVVETTTGELLVLEKIPSHDYGRKLRIAHALRRFSTNGLVQVVPYLIDRHNEVIPLIDHGLWQLCPFVKGVGLNRPAYALDGWRGEEAASFLIALNNICKEQEIFGASPPFSIVRYCRHLFALIENKQPALASRFRPFLDHLEKTFFPVHDHLPTGFCHGDFHPMNILWGKKSIRAVIDWEFSGLKPEIYDLANLLGCLGIEDPKSLFGPFVHRLVNRLKRSGIFSKSSWRALPDMLVAIRFAWLSEWLRKNDRQMVRLEADYMALLLDPSFLRHPFLR